MNSERYASVWDAISDTPAQAENMKLRSELMMALRDHIARAGMSQAQAAKLLGVTQPRVSGLVRGKYQPVRPRCAGEHGVGSRLACGAARDGSGLKHRFMR